MSWPLVSICGPQHPCGFFLYLLNTYLPENRLTKDKGFTVKQKQATDESTLPNQRLHSPTPLSQEKLINDLSLVITLAKPSESQGSLICAHGS